ENNNGNFPGPQDFNNLAAEYGTGSYHQPYNSTTSFVWMLPFGHGQRWGDGWSTAVHALLGGWQLAGIHSLPPRGTAAFTYTPAAAPSGSGLPPRVRGAYH